MRANNSIIWNILAWWFYLFIYLFIYSFIYYLFIYSLNKYKLPNFFVCTNKLLHVCNRCIVFKCVSRTLTTFNTEHFARLVKMKMIHDANFHHDWFIFSFFFRCESFLFGDFWNFLECWLVFSIWTMNFSFYFICSFSKLYFW